MEIKGLLRFMKPFIEPTHIKKYACKRVGIDAYSWLHKGESSENHSSNGTSINSAPYEVVAQLAYLATLEVEKGGVAAVITEDSDLIAYGCLAITFKMDHYGNGEELVLPKVFDSLTSKPSFRNFDKELFTGMCVLAGCDFLPSVPVIGIVKVYSFVTKYQNLGRTPLQCMPSSVINQRLIMFKLQLKLLTILDKQTAYGQTGSEKTYTIWGPTNALFEETLSSDQQGLTPRVFQHLFDRINEEQIKHADKYLKYQILCSFLQGLSSRRTGVTSINPESSRSHSVLTCVVKSRYKSVTNGVSCFKTSRINFVDLAGSERQKLTGSNKRVSLNWINVLCTRQLGGIECGYYVCKFMKEIVENGLEVLVNKNVGDGKEEYTDDDIDDIRKELVSNGLSGSDPIPLG
ncbi:hypothetical protein F3Y22_tig00111648pilonHSYRG00280 [Hibiscus syriacus]|uniref:Kinesin-like protein n=1 Tax=Hibiscus syriacus TaxID=106335 RepID=A0A6A2XHV9_HIBSY|nr:hypothetical protein F3Y22_tig00111648pilonHSYRG00280 [Hibiscus syriacus]